MMNVQFLLLLNILLLFVCKFNYCNFEVIVLICSCASHRDTRYLYLSMEFLQGGELFSHFRQAGCFKGSVVRFYACEIILALEYLHNLSIVYRWKQRTKYLVCLLIAFLF
jgi:serine/threonine protein kinase